MICAALDGGCLVFVLGGFDEGCGSERVAQMDGRGGMTVMAMIMIAMGINSTCCCPEQCQGLSY